ncbi:ABC transporter permease [Labrys wisconsinensis]|uniref:Autoinducer 2 import system permease protein LsrD n=1 Tax=Labrys wisconsinensis TaxID=425677 RepID=A0ABU0JLK4_9HYPH|nr:ABC transporter permease [Labrys wisconsinensis]MDQ0475176.1 ribose/xylose/arabinose/galactoside ABC-type transport system permease subunit [Labrys wisconsinensis]
MIGMKPAAAMVRYPVWAAVLLLYAIAAAVSPAMLKPDQVLNILQVTAFLGLAATGQTIALLVGGIDLSIAGVVTTTNIVATSLMLGQNGNIPAALACCLALGIAVGLVNGVLVAVLRVAPIIATLAINSILFGAALVYTGGAPRGASAPGFNAVGQGSVLGLPASALCWIAVALAVAFVLRRTTFGRWLYAVGANETAARLMGVPTRAVLVAAYTLSAVLAVLAGLLVTAYVGNPSLGIGNQFLLTSVVAAVVGGTALTGGIGSVVTTLAGALFVTELNSFTNIAQASTGAQYVIQGILIAVSVVVYRLLAERAASQEPPQGQRGRKDA